MHNEPPDRKREGKSMPSVTPDIYGWDRIYASTFSRLKADPSIPVEENRELIISFCKSREARGLSIPRVVKYANQLNVIARFCGKPFESMSQDDVRDLLVELKNKGKHNQSWTRQSKYSESTMCDIKIFLKIFWRWMKGMDETKPIYPPEVSWFTKGRIRNSALNRADLLTDSEIDLLASATGDAQDSAFVRVLDDAGGRITEILTLRIGDVEERPYGFRLNVWASKTCAHPIPDREVCSGACPVAFGAPFQGQPRRTALARHEIETGQICFGKKKTGKHNQVRPGEARKQRRRSFLEESLLSPVSTHFRDRVHDKREGLSGRHEQEIRLESKLEDACTLLASC